jgi:uncharacterized protein
MTPAAVATDPSPGSPARIDAMDAARGLAVCGIVLLNVYNFSMPPAAYFNPLAHGHTGAATLAIWAVESILAQDAFRAVFAMLFGAGVAIQLERGGTLRGHFARMLVLLAIGYVHALLLNNGDVLRLYALTGLLLPPLLRLRQRGLLIAMAVLAAVHLGALGWFAGNWLRYWWDVERGMGDPAALAMWEGEFGTDPGAIERGLALGQESLGQRIARRAFEWRGPLVIFLAFFPQTLAAMLLGVWAWRGGLLQGRWGSARARRFAIRLARIALPPMIALCVAAFWSGFAGTVVGTTALVWSQPFAIALGLGYIAALLARWGARPLRTGIGARLAAAGRLSLSNYIGASILMAALFHSWGLARFGLVNRFEATLAALGVIALILLVSPLWGARFGTGPCERLWRGATRLLA